MFKYKKYLIKDSDQFDPQQFPFVIDEAAILTRQTENTPPIFKAEIIISFLKHGSIKSEWTQANPELTALVTSGTLTTSNFESLFESCQHNPTFSQQIEGYLKNRLSNNTSDN